jgi:hypothetical protein
VFGVRERGKQKFHVLCIIGMFYYTLGNLRPELRSTHRAVQLIACVTSSHVKEYGLEPILRPFVDDVNELAKVLHYYYYN